MSPHGAERVLHLTRDLAPRVNGGISVMVRALIDARTEAGKSGSPAHAAISFDAWRPRRGGDPGPEPEALQEAGIAVLRLNHPAWLARAHAFADACAPTVIAVHHAFLWDIGAAIATRTGAGTRYYVHVVQAELDRIRGVASATRSATAEAEALARADQIVCFSAASAGTVRELVPAATTVVIRVPLLPADMRPRPSASRSGGPDGSPPFVLYAGRFDIAKGTDVWFEAMAAVATACPDVRFVIAGGMPDSAKIERRWLRRWSPRWQPFAERVELAGWLERADLAEKMAQAAVVVVPSRAETFGLVAAEAMAAGARIVAADCRALVELLAGYDDVRFAPVGDAGALADAVIAAAGLVGGKDALRAT